MRYPKPGFRIPAVGTVGLRQVEPGFSSFFAKFLLPIFDDFSKWSELTTDQSFWSSPKVLCNFEKPSDMEKIFFAKNEEKPYSTALKTHFLADFVSPFLH